MTACSSTGANTVRIYSSIPLHGASGPDNATVVTAIKQALAARNYQAGPYKIEFISLDGSAPQRVPQQNGTTQTTVKWDAAQEQKNARRAGADPTAVAYIGTINSGAAEISVPILNRVGLAMISPANSYPGLTKTDGALAGEPYKYEPLGPSNRNFCRTATTDDFQGADAALYLQQKAGVKSVYVLDDTEVYGRGVARIFAGKASQIGLTVLSGTEPEHIDPRTTASYTDLAAKIVKAKPDAVYFGGVVDNRPADVLQALRAAGFQGVFMGADGIAETAFEQKLPSTPGRVFATILGLPPEKLTGAGATWYRNWQAQNPGLAPSA
ncbi:MAG: branched-chain amino acid ABC transporter substrate-binding protein, partial [Dehalococcoidia bacterium]